MLNCMSSLLFLFLVNVKPSVPNIYYPTESVFHNREMTRLAPQVNLGAIPYYWKPFVPETLINQQWNQPISADRTVLNRIVGGVPAKKGDYPFIAGFYVWVNPSAGLMVQCAGSLIDSTHVLTAAHCLYDHRSNVVDLTKVHINTLKFPVTGDISGVVTRKVKAFHIHPNYDPIPNINDIAVVTLAFPVPDSVKPVQLPTSDTDLDAFVGYNATVLGWGATDPTKPSSSDVLLESSNLYIVNNSECSQRMFDELIPGTQICATGRGLASPCMGDSGGPLLVDGVQVGVTSYGRDCDSTETTSVYSRISAYRDWIDTILGKDATDAEASCSNVIGKEGEPSDKDKTMKTIEEMKNNKKSLIKIFKPAHKESQEGNQFYVLAHEGLTHRYFY